MAEHGSTEDLTRDVIRKKIGRKIKLARVACDLKQNELSERCGLMQSAVSRIEKGQSGLYVEHLIALAKALECSTEDLIRI